MKAKSKKRVQKGIAMATTFALLPSIAIIQPFDAVSAVSQATGRTIYVSNGSDLSTAGTGNQDSPYESIKFAIDNAVDGDVIVLTDNIVFSSREADQLFKINKDITIDGGGHTLQIRGADLLLQNNVQFKDITLFMLPDGSNRPKIYANGYKLSLYNVNTYPVATPQAEYMPTIYGGSNTSTSQGSEAIIEIKSDEGSALNKTRLSKIIAGNKNGSLSVPVKIGITNPNTIIDNGVDFGGDNNNQVTGKVVLESNSKNIFPISGNNSSDNTTVLTDVTHNAPVLSNIKNLSLKGSSKLYTKSSMNLDNLSLDGNTILSVGANEFDEGSTLTAKNVVGSGEVTLSADSNLVVQSSIADTVNVKVDGSASDLRANLDKVYVTVANAANNPNVALKYDTDGLEVTKEGSSYILKEKQTDMPPAVEDTAEVDPNKTALDKLEEDFEPTDKVADNLEKVKEDILYNFEKKGDDVAMSNVVPLKTEMDPTIIREYYIPLLNKFKADNNIPFRVDLQSEEDKKKIDEYIPIATKEAIRLANEKVTNNDELEAISVETKAELASMLDDLLKSKPNLTVEELKADLPILFRGAFYLQQQFNFEPGLVRDLIFEPGKIKGIYQTGLSPYDRLKGYGGTRHNPRISLLIQNETLFRSRGVSRETGFANIDEMVAKLAEKHGMTTEEYYKKQTEALLAQTDGQNAYEAIKTKKHSWYHPLLAQGKGVYVASTENAITIGMLETYKDLYPAEAVSKVRGEEQPSTVFFQKVLEGFDNYMHFLNDVKQKPVPFVTVTDSMNHKYDTNPNNIGEWSKESGEDAAFAVRRFLAPMKIHTFYNKGNGLGFGGVSTSASSLVAQETRLLHPNMQGVSLFSHEMTHGNDEEALFNGVYKDHGRRKGQGPELYARGLFEAIDNSQDTSEYKPVFNINTAIPIPDKEARVQALEPLKSKEKIEKYFKNLLDLVAYLEAKEAEVAIEVLQGDDKSTYFNKVSQVTPMKNGAVHTEREAAGNTNDRYAPYGKLGNAPMTEPTTIADLVNQDAVSGQFIPNGRSPFIANLESNQYDAVPLLDSYYAASIAEPGKNTVGDVSFKRHAYEVLGWKGWDAFIEYISDRHSSDQEAYTSILKGDAANWADYKIDKYNSLSKLKPVEELWSEEELKTKLKDAIQEDLKVIKAVRKSADPILDNYNDTPTERFRLSSAATNVDFDNRASNVRKVKLDILRRALNHNNLMETVLMEDAPEAPAKLNVTYSFNYLGSDESNFNKTGVELPSNREVDPDTELITTENYTQLIESKDKMGEWKFKGWNPASITVTEDTNIVGTWEYKDYIDIEITESIQYDDQMDKDVRDVIFDGEKGLRSPFNNSVVKEMKQRIVKVGTREPAPILDRQPSIDEVTKKAEDKIRLINDNNLLTTEEKNKAIEEVNNLKNESIRNINEAETQENIGLAKNKGVENIDAVTPTALEKPSAKDEFKALAEVKKQEVLDNTNLVDTEKAALVSSINALISATNNNILSAVSNSDVLNKKNEGIKALNDLLVEPVVKPAASLYIQDIANKKIDSIANNDKLTDEEKNKYIAMVNDEKEKALEQVTSADTLDQINEIKSNAKEAIDGITVTPSYKEIAKEAITTEADAKIKEIDSNSELTSDEKDALKKAVNLAKEKALESVDNAKTNSDVDNAENRGISDIKAVEIVPVMKSKGIDAIEKALADKKAAIDKNEDLTLEEKESAKTDIEKLAENGKERIKSSDTNIAVKMNETAAVTAINSYSPTPIIKSEAKSALEKAMDAKKDEIDSSKDLTKEEKISEKLKLDEMMQKYIADIDKASKNADVNSMKSDYIDEINEFSYSPKVKNEAVTAIKQKAIEKIALIENSNLSDEEKENLKAEVSKIEEEALGKISNLETNEDVRILKESSIKEIDDIKIEQKDNNNNSSNNGTDENPGNSDNSNPSDNSGDVDNNASDTENPPNDGNASDDNDSANNNLSDDSSGSVQNSTNNAVSSNSSNKPAEQNGMKKNAVKKSPKTGDQGEYPSLMYMFIAGLTSLWALILGKKEKKK